MIKYAGSTDAADSISTNVSCNVPINVANIASTNYDDKKVEYKMDCGILHAALLNYYL